MRKRIGLTATMKTLSQRVIKASSSAASDGTSYNMIDLRTRFDSYADEVKKQCRDLIDGAKAEAASIRKAARDEGRAEGFAEGLKSANEQIEQNSNAQAATKIEAALSTAAPAVQEAAMLLDEHRFVWLARWETAAVDMAIKLTERLTSRMIERDATVVRDRALLALQLAAGSSQGHLHMNPKDIESLGSLAYSVTADTSYELVADNNIEAGGCILRSHDGEVDAQLSTQIERIVEELLGSDEDFESSTTSA